MEMWLKGLHSTCNMGTHGLPDMYTLSPQACGPQASGSTYQADMLQILVQTVQVSVITTTYIVNIATCKT